MKSLKPFRRIVVSVSVAFATVLAGGLPASAAAPIWSPEQDAVSVEENTTEADVILVLDATDGGENVTYTILTRLDNTRFRIVNGDELTWAEGFSPNFENPQQVGDDDNKYLVDVRATSAVGGTSDLEIEVTVVNVENTLAADLVGIDALDYAENSTD